MLSTSCCFATSLLNLKRGWISTLTLYYKISTKQVYPLQNSFWNAYSDKETPSLRLLSFDFLMSVELLTFSTILTGYFGTMVAQNPSGPLALFSAGDFCWL